jgi:hypothetical protein
MGDSEPIEFRRVNPMDFLRVRIFRIMSQKTKRNDTKARKPKTANRAIPHDGKLFDGLEPFCRAPPFADAVLFEEEAADDAESADLLDAAAAAAAAEAEDAETDAREAVDCELNTESRKFVSK